MAAAVQRGVPHPEGRRGGAEEEDRESHIAVAPRQVQRHLRRQARGEGTRRHHGASSVRQRRRHRAQAGFQLSAVSGGERMTG